MIKCPHLTPKSIYSNIGDFVADLYLDEVHMPLKKTSSRNLYISFLFSFLIFLCEYPSGNLFMALNNSLKIFYKFIANLLKYSSQSELNSFCVLKRERTQI